ncbi:hypothetical protein COCCADRAFT_29942 [Bipolaris zeicola 26-R-13]|uniref:Uncharacterized protein n=1 Tax=Cochliobolus carbonum (strain 26-R-13) TaxID=930089 RepID=W6Y1K4_COCC2|nr:uncharacterized protein COCCADRAFT_29942 [Bipolaris zeicola 26-R-13]EUC28889.1 hypothetical protein COCCADRAFT_29942 [Bipolaris zeicola 26-R-13]
MWKRLQGHVREKEKHAQIGHPVLLETTYDQDQLHRNPNVAGLHDPEQQNYVLPPLDSLANQPCPSSKPSPNPTITTASGPPTLPPVQRLSAVPTIPSVYSRASIEDYYYGNPAATLRSNYDDLSPPSSPESEKFLPSFDPPQSIRDISLRDFSSMDDSQRKLQDEPRDVKAIPVLRRAPSVIRTGDVQSGHKQKFWEGKLAPNSKVKWDEYSGEPNSAGKASSVDPHTYAVGVPSAGLKPMGYQVSVSAAGPEKKSLSFGERLSRFGSKRSPPVVKNQPGEKSLQIPRATTSPSSDQVRSNTLTVAVDSAPTLADTRPVTAETANYEVHEGIIKPVVPLKVGKKSPAGSSLTSPTSPTAHGLGISAFAYPSPVTPKSRDGQKQSPAIVIETELPIHPAYRTATPPETDKRPIASQFSWSTYSQSITSDQHSPPPSPPLSASSSVLLRRRPVPHSDRIPDSRPNASRMLSPSNVSTFSTASGMSNTSKALPHPPTALCALDHIALLESQQEDLRIRRNNVYRLLTDLNNAAPPNPLLTDFKKAKAVEHKKKAFEVELDDIRREEHDVGLKLHRAWKKREQDDPNAAGSALWVRRVTS